MWIDERVIESCEQVINCLTWVPESVYVVLGNANRFETECNVPFCLEDKVPVLRRSGGGGAVVLHPGCVILSVGMWVKHYYRNAEYFQNINDTVIRILKQAHPEFHTLSQAGISDITLENKKIAGTSLFRSRNFLLYQASILVEDQLHWIERYLSHPTQEPAYRNGKSHREFIKSLSHFKSSCTSESVSKLFEESLSQSLQETLKEDCMLDIPLDQIHYLRQRFGQNTKV